MSDQIHEGHRARMTQRFLETGLSGFQPHEVLEMQLYYVLPRRNTNPVAHRLLERFGTISAVLTASPEALCSVEGVSEKTAAALRFFREMHTYLAEEQSTGILLAAAEEAGSFFRTLYQLERNEVVRAAYLDENLRLKHCVTISEGHPSASPLLIRKVTEHAFAESSNALILAHNHPNGTSVASQEDIAATQLLCRTLQSCGIELVDHVIIGTDGVTSLRGAGVFFGIE